MGVKHLEDLVAFQLALHFKRDVYSLVRSKPDAYRDLRWRSQLYDSAASVETNIAEGCRRFKTGELLQFFRYALSSLEEAKRWLLDGVDRAYYSAAECQHDLTLGNRCGAALMALIRSLQRNSGN